MTRRAFTYYPHHNFPGPYRPGARVYVSNYPPDYVLNLLDPPRLSRAGTVMICGAMVTVVQFDDGGIDTAPTKGLFPGEPPE